MPNGGVPLHMVIRPRGSGVSVLYCQGAEVRVVARADWERLGVQAEPVLVLGRAEGQVLERFLRYWLQDHDEGPIYRHPDVEVEYDF